jgi:hypothetical protein
MDKVSDTLIRGSIERMERELDGVERIEDTVEAMIGRMTIVRDLLRQEMSKVDVLGQILSGLGGKLAPSVQNKAVSQERQAVSEDVKVAEMVALQNLIGVRNSGDVEKIVSKGDRLEKELLESNLQDVTATMDET